jgi:uncharacterized protein (TIGR00251 family)
MLDVTALAITVVDDVARFGVRAKPRASKSRVVGVKEGALEVAVAAPPVDGQANEEIVATLARALGVPRSSVVISKGASGKNKVIAVRGLTEAELRARLAAL